MGRDFGSMGGNVIDKNRNKLLGRLAFQNYLDACKDRMVRSGTPL